jgi:prevent-host-death family protein
MRVAPLKEVKDRFSEFVEAAQTSPIVVTRNGKPVVVMSAIDNESDLDTLFLASNARFIAVLEAADARISATGGLSEDDFWVRVSEDGESRSVSRAARTAAPKRQRRARSGVRRRPKPRA